MGYFMNQCAVYINKLDEYRKNVNRKIKTGQIDDLYKSSSRPFEKELEELYHNFDKAFLKLYPNFVEKFNSLLKPEERYKGPTEYRITHICIDTVRNYRCWTDCCIFALFCADNL